MKTEQKLKVTATNGVRTFTETATPYNKNAHSEQYGTCIDSIHEQMKNAGVYEARDSYNFDEKID